MTGSRVRLRMGAGRSPLLPILAAALIITAGHLSIADATIRGHVISVHGPASHPHVPESSPNSSASQAPGLPFLSAEARREAAKDVALTTPVAGGDPPQAGWTGWERSLQSDHQNSGGASRSRYSGNYLNKEGIHIPEAQAAPQVIKDDLGRPFALPDRAPERIVSLAPNVTEILFALGLGDRVVGVTRFCDHPHEAGSIPKVGGLIDPNVEIVRSLDPDLVIGFRGNPLRVLDRIGKLGLPVFVLDIGRGLESLFPLIEKIGAVTLAGERAGRLAAGLRERAEAVGAAMTGVGRRPRVFVLLYGQGLWTSGGESYLDDLIDRAGAVNVASALPKKWALYKREQILKDDPEVVFVLSKTEEDFARARDWLERQSRLESVEAVRTGRVHRLDEDAASRFGPRLVDVLERMARLLHPERFGEAL